MSFLGIAIFGFNHTLNHSSEFHCIEKKATHIHEKEHHCSHSDFIVNTFLSIPNNYLKVKTFWAFSTVCKKSDGVFNLKHLINTNRGPPETV